MRTRTIATIIAATALLPQRGLAQGGPPAGTPGNGAVINPSTTAPATADPVPAAIQKGQMEVPGQPGVVEDKHAFGVLPNYRTAESNVAYSPISARLKFRIATDDTRDGPSFVLAAFFSGLSQIDRTDPSFGQGTVGFPAAGDRARAESAQAPRAAVIKKPAPVSFADISERNGRFSFFHSHFLHTFLFRATRAW